MTLKQEAGTLLLLFRGQKKESTFSIKGRGKVSSFSDVDGHSCIPIEITSGRSKILYATLLSGWLYETFNLAEVGRSGMR